MIKLRLHERIRIFRLRAGMTQRQLGGLIGRTEGAISRWEAGERSPRANELPAIARALGVSPADLLPAEEPAA